MWNLPAPPGFQGLRDDLPLRIYMRNLPHWRQDGATYFVTYRLGDALPQSKLRELRALKADWQARHPPPHPSASLEELARQVMQQVENWLDQGMGECLLRDPRVRDVAANSLSHFSGEHYELGCFVVMPNHVHAVIRPLQPTQRPLEKILQSCKGYSSRAINLLLSRHENCWQDESFDRIIRDEEHLYRVIQYIGRNPATAGLDPETCRRWINPTWFDLGWRFEETPPLSC